MVSEPLRDDVDRLTLRWKNLRGETEKIAKTTSEACIKLENFSTVFSEVADWMTDVEVQLNSERFQLDEQMEESEARKKESDFKVMFDTKIIS